jgi:hypothetical protein
MQHLQSSGELSSELWGDLVVVVAFILASLMLGAATLRRRTS